MINQNIIFKKIEAQALKDNNIYIVCGDGLDIAEKYNFVGYGDYAVRKCLKISELDKLVKSYFGIKKFKLFKPKCKQNENGIIIKHKFCGFTYKKEYV